MLAVRLPEQELKSLLDDGLSIAAVNSPSTTVVSGSHGAVDRLKNRLGNLKVPLPSCPDFTRFPLVDDGPGSRPFYPGCCPHRCQRPKNSIHLERNGQVDSKRGSDQSGLLGATLSGNRCVLPSGWRSEPRRPDFVLLEVGPGHTLRQATTQQWRRKLEYEPLTSLPSPQEERSSTSHLFRSLGCLWLAGVPIDWEAFHSGWNRQRLALPTYPFERKRYWVEAKMPRGGPQELVQEPPPEKTSDTVQVSLQASAATLGAGLPASIGSAQAAVVSLLRELSALDDLSPTATFVEMGLDSLFLSQVSLSLQSRFGIKITFRQLQQELSTINALAAHLEKVAPEKLPVSRPEMSASATTAALADSSQAAFSEIYRDRSTSPYRPPEIEPAEELSPRQRKHLDELISRYTDRTSRSKQLTQVHRPHMADPRSVAGFRLFWKEMVYPIVTEWSQGSKVRDVDGNEYVDLTMGFGANLFGHAPPFITEALQAQLGRGMEIGPQSILSGEVADMICKMTGSDRAAFCNTGSEAVLAALRMARTVTRKNKVALFAGSYHGVFDEVLVRPPATRGQSPLVPLAPGIPRPCSTTSLSSITAIRRRYKSSVSRSTSWRLFWLNRSRAAIRTSNRGSSCMSYAIWPMRSASPLSSMRSSPGFAAIPEERRRISACRPISAPMAR